jgi:hypothetical protein
VRTNVCQAATVRSAAFLQSKGLVNFKAQTHHPGRCDSTILMVRSVGFCHVLNMSGIPRMVLIVVQSARMPASAFVHAAADRVGEA